MPIGSGTGGPDVYLDVAIYHCQQAAEKALKALLVFHDQRFQKTHDLRVLVELARPFDATIDQCLGLAERLTPYATASS
ncbi:MAG: HEPN domain-containing protein [Gammaproteobacteria bacterium]